MVRKNSVVIRYILNIHFVCTLPVVFFSNVGVIALFLLLQGCATQPHLVSIDDYHLAYEKAVKDAAIAEPDEIYKDLVAIVPSNKELHWKDKGEDQSVLVLTWTSWSGYDQSVGQSMTLEQDVWVTAVPKLKVFCENLSKETDLVIRLKQLLGLPLDSDKTKFVEIWVRPKDLFRPSADPEISDHEAEIDFPTSKFYTLDEGYQKWYIELKIKSYGENGYPWTRLGYTYDWGNSNSEVGLSEFVIGKGAAIEVHAISSTIDYCRQ